MTGLGISLLRALRAFVVHFPVAREMRRGAADISGASTALRRAAPDVHGGGTDIHGAAAALRRATVEARRATVEARRTAVEARRATVEARRAAVEARRAAVEARRAAIALRDASNLFDVKRVSGRADVKRNRGQRKVCPCPPTARACNARAGRSDDMPKDFLPSKDQDLDAWSQNFSTKISGTPTAYGLVAADATAYAALATDFTARLAAAVNPASRTKVTIEQKDASKAALKLKARALAKVINAYPPITNGQRAELGLTVRDVIPTPVPPPTTQPVVNIDGSGGGVAKLRIADETSPTRKAKPAGVFGALVYTKVGPATDPAPVTVADAEFSGVATRFNHTLPLPAGSAGKTLWVLAQWFNERGENGPTSVVASAMIAA